ncbi:MAG: diguanylate cyclase (GGDEF)-like protein [Gammaproteobacteria bacterium]|jgi:diguanylate cyclase (GGDEF)-like protein
MNINANDGGSGAERRRYVRLPIKLDALVAIDGRPPIPCTVRDFCVAGIFVGISQQQLGLVRTQTNATLHFALTVEGIQQNHQLSLTIFRIIGSGFGCGFENADPSVINFLQGLALRLNPQLAAQTPEDVAASQSRFSTKFPGVQKPLDDIVKTAAEKMCADFLLGVDKALFLAARDAGNNIDEGRYLDGQNEIRGRAESISSAVPTLLRKGVSIINSPLSLVDDNSEAPKLPELSLIDKDEFEEFLTLSQLVSDLEPRFKKPLYEIERRFSELANRPVDERSNPLGPAVVGGVFAEELKNLRSDTIAINVVYQSLRKVLELNLDALYKDINELMVKYDILPTIEKEKSKFKRPLGAEASAPNPGTNLEDPAGDETPTPQPNENYPGAYAGYPSVQAAVPQMPVGGNPHSPKYSPGYAGGQPAGGEFNVIDPGAPATQHPPSQQVNVLPGFPPVGQAGRVGYSQSNVAQPGMGQPGMAQPGMGHAGASEQGQPYADGQQGGIVQPGTPSHPGQVSAGPAGAQGGSYGGLEATFGGFGAGPEIYVPPSLQQAYSAAQTQMALRRNLLPELPSEAIAIGSSAPAYAPAQLIDGLTNLQRSMVNTLDPQMLDVHGIKERIVEAISETGGGAGAVGETESDAIEVIANLFEVLIEDALLTDTAKAQLKKLQAPVHKTALMDPAFFEATDHPVRQLLNRVSMLRDSKTDLGGARNAQVSKLIDQINTEFARDPEVLRPIVSEFDQILHEQRNAFDENVAAVVEASEEQDKVLSARRDKNLEATGRGLNQQNLPEEWNRWLDRSRLLEVDERLIMNANTNKPYLVTLAWVGPEFNPFVFVDDKGDKSSTLTLQQVAMYLRRGTLKQLLGEDVSAVDRALFGVVNRMHGEVESQATHDTLTDFMNRKSFVQSIERNLPEELVKSSNPVLCHIVIDNLKTINDQHGVEAGDALISSVAEILCDEIGRRKAIFGRLAGGEIGIFWYKGGLQNAYKKLQECFKLFAEDAVTVNGELLIPVAYAGITAIEDGLTTAEQLVAIVSGACTVAKSANEKPIYVAGSENKYREQLEQMVAYIGKAFDRDRLVLLHQSVKSLTEDNDPPALHTLVTAEDRNGKLVPPEFFEQALVNSERAFEVDQWRLKKSFRWMADNTDEVDNYSAVIVPLSHASVRRDDLANLIITELMETAVPPGKIFFEITDRDAIANVTETAELVRTLKEFGCRFILDEFGSGQGNYDYVKELAVDFVTIDSGFIKDAAQNAKDYAMAKSINELVHFMGKKTIGKQDPSTSVVDILREIGVDFVYDKSATHRIEV